MADAHPSISRAFVRRTWYVLAAIVALAVAWQLASVVLLVFSAIIVAVMLRSISDPIRDRTPLGDKSSLIVAALVLLGVLAGAGWLFGATVNRQIEGLLDRLPRSPAELEVLLRRLPLGGLVADELEDPAGLASRLQGVAGRVSGYALNVLGALTNLLLVLVAGVYLAIRPREARDGLLTLAPRDVAGPLREAMDESGRALRLWLFGTFADMVVVGVLTAIGTAIIGLPSPVALGLFAGLASFVPIIGPIVSALPAMLLALQTGPTLVLWTVLVYVIVQQIESNLIFPFIQRRAVNLPPVLTLFGVVSFGVLFGPLGVVLATPMVVVLMVMTKMLYVRNTLGKEISVVRRPDPG